MSTFGVGHAPFSSRSVWVFNVMSRSLSMASSCRTESPAFSVHLWFSRMRFVRVVVLVFGLGRRPGHGADGAGRARGLESNSWVVLCEAFSSVGNPFFPDTFGAVGVYRTECVFRVRQRGPRPRSGVLDNGAPCRLGPATFGGAG